MTVILLHESEKQLMMAQFDVWFTNQQKEAFHSCPHVEIEYSSCLLIFYPWKKQTKKKPQAELFVCLFFKWKRPFSHFSTFNLWIKKMNERMIHRFIKELFLQVTENSKIRLVFSVALSVTPANLKMYLSYISEPL